MYITGKHCCRSTLLIKQKTDMFVYMNLSSFRGISRTGRPNPGILGLKFTVRMSLALLTTATQWLEDKQRPDKRRKIFLYSLAVGAWRKPYNLLLTIPPASVEPCKARLLVSWRIAYFVLKWDLWMNNAVLDNVAALMQLLYRKIGL